jgi:hypothetical protein
MGATERGFQALALAAGIDLGTGAVAGMTGRGHLAAGASCCPPEALAALARIHRELGGDVGALRDKREVALRPDFLLGDIQIVEVDEVQHFTSDRARALELYPSSVALGFDKAEYLDLCRRWAAVADRYRAAKPAADFPGRGGRRAQRAYLDAVRDLLAPTLTGAVVIRAPAADCDAALALERVQHLLEIGAPA